MSISDNLKGLTRNGLDELVKVIPEKKLVLVIYWADLC